MREEIINFATWYSGMEKKKVESAFERYLKETDTTLPTQSPSLTDEEIGSLAKEYVKGIEHSPLSEEDFFNGFKKCQELSTLLVKEGAGISESDVLKIAKEKAEKHKFIDPADAKFYEEVFCEAFEILSKQHNITPKNNLVKEGENMGDAEKIKAFEAFCLEYSKNHKLDYNETYCLAMSAMQFHKNLVKEEEKDSEDWISCEIFPDKKGKYLVHDKNVFLGYQFAVYFFDGRWWDGSDQVHPQFWKHLPNPPKQEQQNNF